MKATADIARQAFRVGLTPLIPLPFVDEWVRMRLLRTSFVAVAEAEGTALSPPVLNTLTQDRQGTIEGCLITIVWWPIRKLLRTVLYFFTIKEVLDWTCEGVLRAEMVRHACRTGALPSEPERVRRVMGRVMIAHPHSPVTRLLMFRKRPPMAVPEESWVIRFVYRMVQLGGGAVLMDAFERGLANEE